jgi:hypothetical protein
MSGKKRKHNKRPTIRAKPPESIETKGAETLTVAWTVSLTTVLLCDLGAVAAHTYVAFYPQASLMILLGGLLLFAGAVVGMLLIGLLPILYRVRQVAPPRGLVGFGVLIAAAPILALLIRIVR